MSERRLRVTVLLGGPGPEREVSLASGGAVAAALRARGHDVFESDIGPDNLAALDRPADVVFPVLHGTFGEDGTLQRIMEDRGILFVGSGSAASALAINKVQGKHRASESGIFTPPCEVATEATLEKVLAAVRAPVVVKPVDSGSSVATHIIREQAGVGPAVRDVVAQFGRALIEQFIEGDEITVGILGGEALPPICVRPKREFYDYAAKYEDDATEYLFDAGHSPAVRDEARALSERAFEAFECRHLARVDWMLDRSGRFWFLEVNTLPGFTSHSLVPKAAARAGVSFDELCHRLVQMAREDWP